MHRLSVWHARLFFRALLGGALAFALLALLTALTDEGGLTLAVRLGRCAPMAPFASALAVGAALAPPRLRGELMAFSTLGEPPTRTVMPALAGALVVAALVCVLLASGAIDAHGYFPVVPRNMQVTYDGAAFIDATSGARALPSGEILDSVAAATVPENALPRFGVAVAVTATLSCSLALAMVAAAFKAWASPGRLLGLVVLLFLLLAGFQASATGRVSASVTLLPALLLIGVALVRYRALDALLASRRERDVVAPGSRRGG